MPIASKNSAISFASGAPPEIGSRSRPPSRSRTFAKTSRSASAWRRASPRGIGLPSACEAADLAADRERPVDEPALDPRRLVEARDCTAAYTFSYTRGTLGSTVGRTCSIASATRSGSASSAIGNPTYAPVEEHQPPEVVRERQVQQHHVVGAVVVAPSRRRRSPSRSSCGGGSCSPSAARSSPRCR